jgi:hypothetical protein
VREKRRRKRNGNTWEKGKERTMKINKRVNFSCK